MKQIYFVIISLIFIFSAVLLVFSLPQCGHGGFSLGAAMDSTNAKACNGNIYDQHILFLQTVFLTKLEWIVLLLVVTSILSVSIFIYQSLQLKVVKVNPQEKLKKYFYQLATPFYFMTQVGTSGRIFQRLLE